MTTRKNPWKTLSTQDIYDNSWIRVTEHQVRNPRKTLNLYGKVHFKHFAIGILPLDPENNTWLVGQWRFTLHDYSWEIPMGGGPINQNKLDSAKRELKEETGIIASQWTEIIKIHTSNSVTDEVGFGYLAQQLTFGEPQFDETEKIAIKKIPFAKVVDWVLKGKITDSLSIATILKTHMMMQQRKI